jgi:hypothetical protein
MEFTSHRAGAYKSRRTNQSTGQSDIYPMGNYVRIANSGRAYPLKRRIDGAEIAHSLMSAGKGFQKR